MYNDILGLTLTDGIRISLAHQTARLVSYFEGLKGGDNSIEIFTAG